MQTNPQPKPITLTPVDIAMLKREHIDWEKEDERDRARLEIQRRLNGLRVERDRLQDDVRFWQSLFWLLACGIGLLAACAGVQALIR